MNYLLRDIDNKKQSFNIVNDKYSDLKIDDRIISIDKSVFNKIASNQVLTNFLLLNN